MASAAAAISGAAKAVVPSPASDAPPQSAVSSGGVSSGGVPTAEDADGGVAVVGNAAPCGGGGETGDASYTRELARRSVARAALHLGVRRCSREVLDALADVLVAFIERLGRSMAESAELGGRSSAHCNVLDALDAAEVNTAPAAFHMIFAPGDGEGQGVGAVMPPNAMNGPVVPGAAAPRDPGGSAAQHPLAAHRGLNGGGGAAVGGGGMAMMPAGFGGVGSGGGPVDGFGWESLATFAFGPDWRRIRPGNGGTDPGPGNFDANNSGGMVTAGATANPREANGNTVGGGGGWRAPYLDVVPLYPTSKTLRVADAARHVPASLMDEACLPEESMATVGSPSATKPADSSKGKDRQSATMSSKKGKDDEAAAEAKRTRAKLAEERAAAKADRIPDEFFFWGSIGGSGGSMTASSASETTGEGEGSMGAVTAGSPTERERKRARFDFDADSKKSKPPSTPTRGEEGVQGDAALQSVGPPCHAPGGAIPSFLPPLPPAYTYQFARDSTAAVPPPASSEGDLRDGRQSSDARIRDGSSTVAISGDGEGDVQSVRSGLVRMGDMSKNDVESNTGGGDGKGYWGAAATASATEGDQVEATSQSSKTELVSEVVVPSGPPSSSAVAPTGAAVAPLAKASSSKISRILEGSMDAPGGN